MIRFIVNSIVSLFCHFLCKQPGSSNLTYNVYNAAELRAAISKVPSGLNHYSYIEICAPYIKMNSFLIGDFDILYKNITISCNLNMTNGSKCILDANGLSRHFSAQFSSLSFHNIVFINGRSSTLHSGGGSLNIWNSNVSISGCDFINNVGKGFGGGAIILFFSSINLLGGVDNYSVAESNIAKGIPGGGGGFLTGTKSTITITNYLFRNNHALELAGAGGALLLPYSRTYIQNTTFQNNSAQYGGAIDIWDSAATTLTNVVFDNNYAFEGTIHLWHCKADISNYLFLRSDPTTAACDMFFTKLLNIQKDSCINLPPSTSNITRRLQTIPIQSRSLAHLTIVDPAYQMYPSDTSSDYQMYPSDHLSLTTNASSETHHTMPHNRSTQRMIQTQEYCVKTVIEFYQMIRDGPSSNSSNPKIITLCQKQYHLSTLDTRRGRLLQANILDGIDISNKNIVFVCSRKRRGKAHRCTLDAGGMQRHFYGSNAKVEFNHIQFINGYHVGAGGALLLENNSDIKLTACSFLNNTALSGAGALLVKNTNLIMDGMVTSIRQNGGNGAPIEIHSSNASMQNVAFTNNNISQFGDGVFVFDSNVDLQNVNFGQNSSNTSTTCNLFISVNPADVAKDASCVTLS